MNEIAGVCKKDGCKVLSTGKCLDGLDIQRCPHFVSKQPPDSKTNEPSKQVSSDETVDLYSGECLNIKNATEITLRSLTKVIVIVGEEESGKTTLLACLNQRFQEGEFAGYLFAGSRTLPAFEKICFPARIASNRKTPETERTKLESEIRLLHLCVRGADIKKSKQHMLFTDISGEYFGLLKDSIEECKKFKILQRADHFVILFDCQKLADITKRIATKYNNISFLRSCIDSNMLGNYSCIDVLFSKYDILEMLETQNKEKCKRFISGIKIEIQKLIDKKVGCLEFYEVAARPCPESKIEDGYGLDRVFSIWVEKSLLFHAHATSDNYSQPTLLFDREFHNYSWKYRGGYCENQ